MKMKETSRVQDKKLEVNNNVKKKVELIPEIEAEFVYGRKLKEGKVSTEKSPYCPGALIKGYTKKLAQKLFASMKDFAKYAFNKSHSGCYAAVGYKTMWAKTYKPTEWTLATLRKQDNDDLLRSTMNDAKRMGICILPPDINKSEDFFSMEINDKNEKCLRFGLSNIKNVGTTAVALIKYDKQQFGDYKNLQDFYTRIHKYKKDELEKIGCKKNPITKRVEEALIKSGCFDFQSINRYTMINHFYNEIYKGTSNKDFVPFKTSTFKKKIKLEWEKDLLGMYISEHPLDKFPHENFENSQDGSDIETTGMLVEGSIKQTKNKTDYGRILIEDKDGVKVVCMLFGKAFKNNKNKIFNEDESIKKNQILVVIGEVNKTYRNVNVSVIKTGRIRKKTSKKKEQEIENFVPPIIEDPTINYA
jgi:DNA polymerase-3 subunit alpha